MSITKGKLRRSAVVVAFTLGAFQALSIVGATSALAVGTCSVSGGVMTVAAPNAVDDMMVAVDTNSNIHVAAAPAANGMPSMVTDQVAACNGGSGGLATITTINITGDSGPTTNNQTVIIDMSVIDAVTFADTATLANWKTVNWTVNLGSNGSNGDSLVIWDIGNTTAGTNITGGVNGFDLNSDGDLDISPVVGVENLYIDSFSNGENNVDLSGSTITGAAVAQGARIGQHPTAPLNQDTTIVPPAAGAQAMASDMATDTGDNTLYGGAGNDVIIGGRAADTIGPGLGSDRVACRAAGPVLDLGGFFGDNQATLDYSNTATAINANLPINTVTQGADLDSVDATCLDVIGTAAADTITGRDGENNWLQPGGQNDTVAGGTNTVVSALLQTGGDTVDYSDATAGVTVDLTAGTATGGSGSDTLSGMENVVGSPANDSITGDVHSNLIWSGAGNDAVKGGPGDDINADFFNGGSGIDTISYADNVTPTMIDVEDPGPLLATGNGANSGAQGDVYQVDTIENAIGGSGDDVFGGSVFNNIFWPNGGQNSIDGEEGIDTVNYGVGYTAGVLVNLSGGGAAGGNQDSIVGVENAVGTAFNDTLIGTDTVGGTNGANLLVGGKGNDNISANAGPDLVRAGAGNDVVRGGSGDDTLLGQGGKDSIRGGQGDDDIFGGKGSDFCVGGAGHDLIKTCEKPRHHHQGPNGPGVAHVARLSAIKP